MAKKLRHYFEDSETGRREAEAFKQDCGRRGIRIVCAGRSFWRSKGGYVVVIKTK